MVLIRFLSLHIYCNVYEKSALVDGFVTVSIHCNRRRGFQECMSKTKCDG